MLTTFNQLVSNLWIHIAMLFQLVLSLWMHVAMLIQLVLSKDACRHINSVGVESTDMYCQIKSVGIEIMNMSPINSVGLSLPIHVTMLIQLVSSLRINPVTLIQLVFR